ncbi:MAG: AHH domain-containing protein [Novosphingobium sp.]|nr:AHH domain-containing protein [Novosphingobium sp.]MCP5402516.1 AHH domain-containing protein [Novosphingobium sp.]
MQRHHLLPRQLLSQDCFRVMFETVGRDCVGFDDFRSNGLLLPASDGTALRFGLPLHRGPHRNYNAMVMERVGQIEKGWSTLRSRSPDIAENQVLMRLRLLQRALRRRILAPGEKRVSLNRKDPLRKSADFSELDAMADALWGATGSP